MKKKSSTKPVRRSLGKGGFINLRVLLALFLAFTGVALAIFAGRDAQCPEPLSPSATCLYRALKDRANLLHWNSWNNTGMTA